MVSTRHKKQSNRRLLSQLDDIDQNVFVGNTASSRQQYVVVNEGTVDQDFNFNITGSNSTFNENSVNVQTLERCFNESVDGEMGNFVDTVVVRIQNEILTAIDRFITLRTE